MLHMVQVAVVVALLLPVANSSPCPNTTDSTLMIDSNRDYVWRDCRITTGATTWTITAANGAQPLTNVYLHVSGGAVLPLFDFSNVPSLVNVSIHVEGYVQTPTSLPVSHAFVVLPLNCMHVQIVLRSCQFAFDGRTPPAVASFVSHKIGGAVMAALMTNVHVAFQSCTMGLALAGQSLVKFHLANNSNSVSVVLEDCAIAVSTTWTDVHLVQNFGIDTSCSRLTGISTVLRDISFRLQRSNITFVQNCSNPDSLCGNSINPADGGLQTSYSAIVHWDTQNVVMVRSVLIVRDTVVVATLVPPSNESDATRISRGMTLMWIHGSDVCHCSLPQLTVDVSNLALSIAFGQAATLLRLDQLDELSDALLSVEDSQVTFSARGALNRDANTRYTAVIYIINETVGPNLTIRITRVIAAMTLLSGEQLPSALASSPLSITYAALVYCTASIKKLALPLSLSSSLVVVVRDCRSTVDISNGSLALYRPPFAGKITALGLSWPSMAMYTMMATLVLFDRQHEVSALTVSIINASLESRAGLTMGTDFATPLLASAAVSSVTTLLVIAANCTACNILIRDSFVNVTALNFPKTSAQLSSEAGHQQRSGVDPGSGFLFLNITSLFQAYDTISLSQYAWDKAFSTGLYLVLMQPIRSLLERVFTTAILYDSVVISIEDSTIYFPASLGSLADVVAFVLTRTVASNVSIDVSSSSSTLPSPSHTSPNDRVFPTAIGMLGSTVERCRVQVTGVSDAGPMIVASLGQSYIGPSTSFVFTNNSFRTRNNAVGAVGVNASLSVISTRNASGTSSGTTTGTATVIFDIRDNTFLSAAGSGGLRTFLIFNRSNVHWGMMTMSSSSLKKDDVVRLGCNLIDNTPLLTSNIGIPNALLRSIVDFPAGYFHRREDPALSAPGSLPWCTGLSSTRTTPIPPPIDQHPSDPSGTTKYNYGATRIAGGVVCVSYALPQLAVSLSSLQRSLQALSLARRCTATGAADAPDDFMADWMSNPLQMHFSSADDGLGWAAGSVVGNVVLIVCLTVVRWLWSSAVAARRSSWSLPVREALRSGFHACGGWVSSYRDAYVALLQPLATAATALAVAPAEAGFTGSPLGYALSAVCLVVVFGPTVRWAWVVLIVWSRRFPFMQELRRSSTASEVTRASEKAGAGALLAKCSLQLNHLLFIGDSLVWRLASKPTIPDCDDQRLPMHPADALAYLPIFDELLIARHWYFVVDFAFCVSTGVVAGAASFSDQCAWGEWLLVAVSVLNIVVVGVIWPYRSRFSSWSALVNLVLCCVVAILAALWYDAAATAVVSTLAGMSMLPTLFAVVVGIASAVYVKPPHDQRGRDLGSSFDASLSLSMQSASDGGHREVRREAPAAHRLAMLIRMACNASRQRQQQPNEA